MTRTYRIDKDGKGSSGFLCPPGHPNHVYALNEYSSPRGRTVHGISPISYALTEEAGADASVKRTVQRILDSAELVESELWIRNIYGYFKSMYAPTSGDRNVSNAISDPTGRLPAERHLAVLAVREYFPDHAPRTDLIADPGKGYGSYPCTKCANRVQYEARCDALAVINTSTWANDGGVCPKGGTHTVD